MNMLEMLVAIKAIENVGCVTLNYSNGEWWLFVGAGKGEFYRGEFKFKELFNCKAAGDYDDPLLLIEMAYKELIVKAAL